MWLRAAASALAPSCFLIAAMMSRCTFKATAARPCASKVVPGSRDSESESWPSAAVRYWLRGLVDGAVEVQIQPGRLFRVVHCRPGQRHNLVHRPYFRCRCELRRLRCCGTLEHATQEVQLAHLRHRELRNGQSTSGDILDQPLATQAPDRLIRPRRRTGSCQICTQLTHWPRPAV